MAIISKKVSEFPVAADPAQFDIFGQDRTTGQSAKSQMSLLKGDTGPAPNITIEMTAAPYGTAPSVDKGGTDTAPTFNIKFPLAADGKTPVFRVSGGYMQYRYADTDAWTNLVAMSTLKGDKGDKMTFADLTDDDIAVLQQPATDAAMTANNAAEAANTAAGNANTATAQANSARDAATIAAGAANTAAGVANAAAANVKDGEDGKTPVFDDSTATALDPSEPPTISLTQTGTDTDGNPVYTLSLGIPQGQQGIQGAPPELVNGTIATGAPGSDVSFTFTYAGTNTNGSPRYRIDGLIPQGMPGAGNGNVEIDASTLEVGKQYVFVPNEDGSPIGTFQEFVPPDTQVQANWNETDTTSKAYIQGKPTLATVATSGAYGDLSGKPNLTPSFVTGNTFAATATGIAQTLQVRSIQNGVGTPVVVQMPVATENTSGVMPAASVVQIQQNTDRIAVLESLGGNDWGAFDTKADLDTFGIPNGAAVKDTADVRVDETHDNATTKYSIMNVDGILQWVFRFVINYIPPSTATTAKLGLVKGSEEDGQIFVETDGTMSVVGMDALKQRVTDAETDLLEKADNTALDAKQNILTSANAGDGIAIEDVGGVTKISASGLSFIGTFSSAGTVIDHPDYNLSIYSVVLSPFAGVGSRYAEFSLILTPKSGEGSYQYWADTRAYEGGTVSSVKNGNFPMLTNSLRFSYYADNPDLVGSSAIRIAFSTNGKNYILNIMTTLVSYAPANSGLALSSAAVRISVSA